MHFRHHSHDGSVREISVDSTLVDLLDTIESAAAAYLATPAGTTAGKQLLLSSLEDLDRYIDDVQPREALSEDLTGVLGMAPGPTLTAGTASDIDGVRYAYLGELVRCAKGLFADPPTSTRDDLAGVVASAPGS